MAWVYLDDQFPDHPKVVQAGGDAAWLFVCGLAYCKRQGTDGRIPRGMVSRLTDKRNHAALARRLVDAGLWDDAGDQFEVHDYGDWNRSQESRSEAGRKAARARWDRERARADASDSHADRNATASDPHVPQDALSPPIPTDLTPPAPPEGGVQPVDNPAVEVTP